MLRSYKRFVVTIMCLLLVVLSNETFAQHSISESSSTENQSLKIGIHISPPFVMKDKDHLTGMAIDLWDLLASNLDLQTEYKEYDTISELVNATSNHEVDVAVTNLTISKERAERIDFTHPWFDSGLRIMVSEDKSTGFVQLFKGLHESGHVRVYIGLVAIIFLFSLVLTFFDRRFDKSFPTTWRDGFAESFYTVMSVATSGNPPSRKNLFGWLGRIWQGVWLVCGIAVLAYVTSSITSVMTTISLNNQINNVSDLAGHRVGVFTGSIAEKYARDHRLDAIAYDHISEAAKALQNNEIRAIIADAPVLEYYAHTHPSASVEVLGPLFELDKYGFGLHHDSTLTRSLTIEVIGAYESGKIAELRTKYFGENH